MGKKCIVIKCCWRNIGFLEGGIFLLKEMVQLIPSGIINYQQIYLYLSALSKKHI